MQLSYRGANYELNSDSMAVKENEIIGKYRGLPVRMTALYQESIPQSIQKLTYRGSSYIGL